MNVIIGAGVSGLAFSVFAKQKSIMVEADQDVGGYCKTIKRNGYTWDYSGHFFHFNENWVKDLFNRYMNDDDLKPINKITSIKYKESYVDFPFQKNIHQLPFDEFYECLYDLIKADISSKERELDAPYSFKQMVIDEFGNGIANKFLIPYNEKLYACDLNELDCNAMGRFFPKASVADIVKNFIEPDNSSYNGTFVYPKGGAIEFIESLRKHSTADLLLNTKVIKVDLKAKEVETSDGKRIPYDNLISSMPLPKLLDICGLKYERDTFTANKVAVFNIGFDKPSEVDDHWIYFPEKKYPFYRVGFYDNIRGDDRMSLYVEVGLPQLNSSYNSDECFEQVLLGLKNAGIINGHNVVDYHTTIMDPAYVHIKEKSDAAKKYFKDMLAVSNVYSIGRYGDWKYCSIEDNVIEAYELARSING